MKVWIDPDLCTSDGICGEICPDVFVVDEQTYLYVVRELPKHFSDLPAERVFDGGTDDTPKGAAGLARIPEHLLDTAIEAAESCPGECIFLEDT